MTPALYKHQNNRDVAIQIKSIVFDQGKDRYLLRVVWWNIGECHNPWCMGIQENIEIPLKKWQREWSLYKPKFGNS